MKYCPNCGAAVKPGAKFCPNCGYQLTDNENNGEGESLSGKVKNQFNQMLTDTEMQLEMETARGLNVTRQELKIEAQRKLSGRYGEWFKSILIGIVASGLLGFIMLYAFLKMNMAQFSYQMASYGYTTDLMDGVSRFFWLLIYLVALIGLLLIICLFNAVMQWCGIFTLKGQRADGLKIFNYLVRSQKNRVLKANILMTIYTFLWSLLLIIPGIVKSASYGMTNYLLEKRPELTASEAIALSRQIMRGYKLEFLILRFSFIFWNYLVSLTSGLAGFYVLPYQSVTEIKFLTLLYQRYYDENTSMSAVNK